MGTDPALSCPWLIWQAAMTRTHTRTVCTGHTEMPTRSTDVLVAALLAGNALNSVCACDHKGARATEGYPSFPLATEGDLPPTPLNLIHT